MYAFGQYSSLGQDHKLVLDLAGGLPSFVHDFDLHLEGLVHLHLFYLLGLALRLLIQHHLPQAFDLYFSIHGGFSLALDHLQLLEHQLRLLLPCAGLEGCGQGLLASGAPPGLLGEEGQILRDFDVAIEIVHGVVERTPFD